MKQPFIALLFVILSLHAYCQQPFPYQLEKPVKKLVLPEILNEVSGLTDIDSAHVACVQDELGLVFIYNFLQDKIIARHKFDSIGDFEGLTYTGKSLFILRSDGRLTEWMNFNPKTGEGKLVHYKLTLLTANNEGLCFDPVNNRLLIAAKSKPVNHDDKSDRFIYEFDLATKKLNSQPVYRLNTDQLAIESKKHGIYYDEMSNNGKPRPFNFRPASLSVHPQSKNIYIISASDKLLLIMNRAGEVLNMQSLSPELFAKAEGITFLNDGTMIITNEAAGNVPTLLVYEQSSQ